MSTTEALLADFPTQNEIGATIPTNTATKSELLSRAKAAIEAGEQSIHEAAEALGLAKADHSATQRELAEAVGRSASWVNKLLKWRNSGYTDHSPFGPTTKTGRVEHAQHRAKTSNPRKPKVTASSEDDAETSAERRKAEYAKQEAEPETSTAGRKSTSRKLSPAEAKGNLIYAIDHWWPCMDDAARNEVTQYFMKKAGVRAQ